MQYTVSDQLGTLSATYSSTSTGKVASTCTTSLADRCETDRIYSDEHIVLHIDLSYSTSTRSVTIVQEQGRFSDRKQYRIIINIGAAAHRRQHDSSATRYDLQQLHCHQSQHHRSTYQRKQQHGRNFSCNWPHTVKWQHRYSKLMDFKGEGDYTSDPEAQGKEDAIITM